VSRDGDRKDQEAIDWLLQHCQDKLSAWELDFLDKIDGTPLFGGQRDKLNEIWDDVVVKRRRG